MKEIKYLDLLKEAIIPEKSGVIKKSYGDDGSLVVMIVTGKDDKGLDWWEVASKIVKSNETVFLQRYYDVEKALEKFKEIEKEF